MTLTMNVKRAIGIALLFLALGAIDLENAGCDAVQRTATVEHR